MSDQTTPFGARDIPITLTGEQWTVILAELAGKQLSKSGKRILHTAKVLLSDRIAQAAEA